MKERFFSVFVDCNVLNGRRIPGVCYRLTESITPTVEDMVERGLARIYEEEVRFVSGVPVKVSRTAQGMLRGSASPSLPSGGATGTNGASPRRPVIVKDTRDTGR